MNPYLRIFLRALFVGVGASLGYLVAQLPGVDWNDAIAATYAGYTGIASYLGLGVFTDLEPTLGVKK